MDLAIPILPLAHAGHWALWIVYLAPVIVVLASVVVTVRREKRRQRDGVSLPPGP
jgi:cytochrome c-type biogenesis protein CcmH/NrfF